MRIVAGTRPVEAQIRFVKKLPEKQLEMLISLAADRQTHETDGRRDGYIEHQS